MNSLLYTQSCDRDTFIRIANGIPASFPQGPIPFNLPNPVQQELKKWIFKSNKDVRSPQTICEFFEDMAMDPRFRKDISLTMNSLDRLIYLLDKSNNTQLANRIALLIEKLLLETMKKEGCFLFESSDSKTVAVLRSFAQQSDYLKSFIKDDEMVDEMPQARNPVLELSPPIVSPANEKIKLEKIQGKELERCAEMMSLQSRTPHLVSRKLQALPINELCDLHNAATYLHLEHLEQEILVIFRKNLSQQNWFETYKYAYFGNFNLSLKNLIKEYKENFFEVATVEEKKALAAYLKTKNNNGPALYELSQLYKDGIGVKKNTANEKALLLRAIQLDYFVGPYDSAVAALDAGNYEGAEIILLFHSLADKNYGPAQYKIGYMYENGQGIEVDKWVAEKWFEKAANNNYPEAQYKMGIICREKAELPDNELAAFRWFKKAAFGGHCEASNELGRCYLEGISDIDKSTALGKNKAEIEGFRWYKNAAEKWDRDAMCSVGLCHLKGIGTAKDPAAAIAIFTQAYDVESREAAFHLGQCYELGLAVPPPDKSFMDYYRNAADQGHAEAQNLLGIKLFNDAESATDENEKDELYNEAFQLFCDAEIQDHAEASNYKGHFYENGLISRKDMIRAANAYLKAARANHAEAQYNYGRFCQNGFTFPKDEEMAVVWFQRSANQKNPNGMRELGNCYLLGKGVQIDVQKGLQLLEEAANLKDGEAAYLLGEYYINRNDQEAINWLSFAANLDHSLSQFTLAEFYEIGDAVSQNIEHAIHLYMKASDNGNAEASYRLGTRFFNEDGVEKNLETAFNFFYKAAIKGHIQAQYMVAYCLEMGSGCQKNISDSAHFYLDAAKGNNVEAQCCIARYYELGLGGLVVDHRESFFWYLTAAEQGHVVSQRIVARSFLNGIGTTKDEKKGFQWALKAAEKEDIEAMKLVRRSYALGLGVKKDMKQIFGWSLKLAKKHLPKEQKELADKYFKGIGIEKNDQEGMKWLTEAANKGLDIAEYELGLKLEKLPLVENQKKAVELYQRGVLKGYAPSIARLGVCYEFGYGTDQDSSKAALFYKLSADKENAEGLYLLGLCQLEGKGTEKNPELAFKNIGASAKKGHGNAQHQLGELYECGIGVKQDLEKAIAWYKKAKDKGNPKSRKKLEELVKDKDDDAIAEPSSKRQKLDRAALK